MINEIINSIKYFKNLDIIIQKLIFVSKIVSNLLFYYDM